MVKVEVAGQMMYLDGYLKRYLDQIKKVIMNDWDCIILVDGKEGAGKSVIAQQVAFYLAEKLDIEDITFRPKEFRDRILSAKKYDPIIFDEAFSGMTATQWASNTNKMLKNLLAEIRQKNLFVVIVCPTFFDLERYFAIWRTRCLINVYTGKGLQRGFFKIYYADAKKMLYLKGKKLYDYRAERPVFFGRFTKFYPISEEEYKNKKLEMLTVIEQEQNKEKMTALQKRQTLQRDALVKALSADYKLSNKEIEMIMAKYCDDPLKTTQISEIKRKDLKKGAESA